MNGLFITRHEWVMGLTMLSGGPLNPQCDMVDRSFSGELFDEPIVQTSSVQTFSGKR